MLDREVVAGDHHAFEQEADQLLAASEVEAVEAVAKRSREGGDVFGDALGPGGVHPLRGEFLGAQTVARELGLQTFAARLELRHIDRPSLVGVDQSLDL